MARGLALGPIALPVFLLLGLAAALRGETPEQQLTTYNVATEPAPPVLPGLLEEQLAIVTERNRQHLENTYRN